MHSVGASPLRTVLMPVPTPQTQSPTGLRPLVFAALRGMSQTQLLIVAGALFSHKKVWSEQGSKDVGTVVAKVLLPCFCFIEFAKPEMKEKLVAIFQSAAGGKLVLLSVLQMLGCVSVGKVVVWALRQWRQRKLQRADGERKHSHSDWWWSADGHHHETGSKADHGKLDALML